MNLTEEQENQINDLWVKRFNKLFNISPVIFEEIIKEGIALATKQCDDTISELRKEVAGLASEVQAKNTALGVEKLSLVQEMYAMQGEIDTLKKENAKLKAKKIDWEKVFDKVLFNYKDRELNTEFYGCYEIVKREVQEQLISSNNK